jgi:hypothetical protein
VAAVAATQAKEAMGQDAALEEGIELVPDELRQIGIGSGLDSVEEGSGELLHQAVKSRLLGAASFVVKPGTIGRVLGLPSDGLHALLTFRPWGLMVRSRARRFNRRW